MPRPALLLTALLLLAPLSAQALWKTLASEAFTVFYPAGREREALAALAALETHRPGAEALVGRKGKRLAVVLEDLGTESNGFADPAFRSLHLYLYPPSTGELASSPNWWGLVGVHEYVHWLHLTAAAGVPGALAWAFGDGWAPAQSSPGWLAEGLAVYAESGSGQGRLNEGFFDAYLEVRAQAGDLPSLAEALFLPPRFPGPRASYLFGGEFVDYLARTYGQEAVTRFLQLGSRSLLSYLSPLLPLAGLDRSARQAFGQRTGKLWRDWQRDSATRAQALPPPRVPASEPAWRLGRPVVHERRLYFLRSQPVPVAPFRQAWRYELRVLDPQTANERTLARFSSAFTGGLRLRDGRLYLAVEDLQAGLPNVTNLTYGTLSTLYTCDPANGRRTRLFREALRAFEVLPGGDVVFSRDRTDSFGSEVLLWKSRPAPGEANPRLLTRSDLLIREILVEQGQIHVSARKDGENFGIYRAAADTLELSPLNRGPYNAGELGWADDVLLFTANAGGRSAVYAAGPEEGTRLTDAPYASSGVYSDGRLWYVGLHPDGFALYNVPLPPSAGAAGPSLPLIGEISTSAPPGLPPLEPRAGGYADNLLTLAPRLLAPVASVDPARASYLAGLAFFGRSALGDIEYSLAGLLDLQTGAPALDAFLRVTPAPVFFTLAATTLAEGQLAATVEVPVLWRLEPVARRLALGLAGYLYGEGLAGRQLQPYLGFALAGALDSCAGFLSLPLERVELGSEANRAVLAGEIALEHSFRIGGLRLVAAGFQVLDGGRRRLLPLRGNADSLAGETGLSMNLDFSIRLLKIRTGLWNPPLFLQDVYVVPFAGLALTDALDRQFAGGLELHWELKALAMQSGWPLDLFVSLAVDGAGTPSVALGLAPVGWEWLARSGPRRN